MRHRTVVLFAFLLFACKPNDSANAGILPPAKMGAILSEMMQVDELITIRYPVDTLHLRYPKSVELYEMVLKNHKTTSADFKSSFSYYKAHPDKLKPVLDSARAILNAPPKAVPAQVAL